MTLLGLLGIIILCSWALWFGIVGPYRTKAFGFKSRLANALFLPGTLLAVIFIAWIIILLDSVKL